jgi:hypothetical protein
MVSVEFETKEREVERKRRTEERRLASRAMRASGSLITMEDSIAQLMAPGSESDVDSILKDAKESLQFVEAWSLHGEVRLSRPNSRLSILHAN